MRSGCGRSLIGDPWCSHFILFMWKSCKDRRAAAKEAKHIMECKLAAAFARVAELELALSSLTSDPELLARLLTIGPCLVAQKQAAAVGTIDTHSYRALVTKDQHIAANAAKHIFGVDFRKLSIADIRRMQRGGKPPAPQLPLLPPLPPPPPPPHLPELDGAMQCLQLEEFRRGLYNNGKSSGEHDSIGGAHVTSHVIFDEASMVFTLVEDDFSCNDPQVIMAAGFTVGDTDLNDSASNGHNSHSGFPDTPDTNDRADVLDGDTEIIDSASIDHK